MKKEDFNGFKICLIIGAVLLLGYLLFLMMR